MLLAEDDAKFAGLLTRALGRIGLAARLAVTGDGALQAIRHDPAVAAVVLDIMIPHPDGIEVCRQLRRNRWHRPILIISALDSTDTRARALRAGADMFLAKPFPLTELLDAVETLLREVDLAGADLRGAGLSGCRHLTTANLRGARFDGDTRWPRALDPLAAGAVRAQH